jgi:soluble lytic murein transglycosylase
MSKLSSQIVALVTVAVLISEPGAALAISGMRDAPIPQSASTSFEEQAVIPALVASELDPIFAPGRRRFLGGLSTVVVTGSIASMAPVVLAAGDEIVHGPPHRQIYDTHAYDDLVRKYAAQYSMPPWLVKAIIKMESDFTPDRESPKKAYGLMGVKLEAAAAAYRFMTNINVDFLAMSEAEKIQLLKTPDYNIHFGCRYFHLLTFEPEYAILQTNRWLLLAAYNAGPAEVMNYLRAGLDYKDYLLEDIVELLPEKLHETKKYLIQVSNFENEFRNEELERAALAQKRQRVAPAKATYPPSQKKHDITNFMDPPVPEAPPAGFQESSYRVQSAA